ncbi:MAG TPA: hypothetical protein VH394_19215 [Thermoanaerobaculia bacterium]|jgi:hypothetical protein|nr:hypothetical protein [Thermoanaerobaculia bacterium]
MNDAIRICARLFRAGAVLRADLPGLEVPDILHDVERRLRSVGLVLATSPHSSHVGLRLAPEVAADPAFEAASNLGLGSEACALLVVLWVRLVLPRWQIPAERNPQRPQVRLDFLARELRPLLGDRRRIRVLVAQLRRLDFLTGEGEVIEAGPLLELGIDGERLMELLQGGVLAGLLEGRKRGFRKTGEDESESFASHVLEILRRLGGSAGMTELVRETGAPASRLRLALRTLALSGRVRRTGERRSTRYHLQSETTPPGGA